MTAVVVLGVVALGQLVLLGLVLFWRRDDHTAELLAVVDGLARRIQAPGRAAYEPTLQEGPQSPTYAPQAIPPDDDEAYWASREELAALAAKDELSGD